MPGGAAPIRWDAPSTFAWLLCGWLLLHAALRLAMWPTLGIDDAEQTLFAQAWQWGYRYRAPPLFTWLLLPLQGVFGPGIVAITVLRTLLLGVLFWATWATARRLLADPRHALLATASYASLYVVGYYAHHDLTATTAMSAMVALTWLQFLRLVARRTTANYLLLGLAVGAGLLAKWNFVLLPLALFGACLTLPATRRVALDPRAALAAIVALACTLPTLVYILGHARDPGAVGGEILGSGGGLAGTLVTGSGELILALIAYPQPFLLLFLACFAWPWLRARRHAVPPPEAPLLLLAGRSMAMAIALLVLLMLAVGATKFAERWMQPVLWVLPIWLFAKVAELPVGRRAWRNYAIGLAALVGLAFAARAGIYLAGADRCGSCRAMAPFAELAGQLRAAGYDGGGTIVSTGFHVGGNLRALFPGARVLDDAYPPANWPPARGDGPCLVAWRGDGRHAAANRDRLLAYLAGPLGGRPLAVHADGGAEAAMFGSTRRTYRLAWRLYPAGNGECR